MEEKKEEKYIEKKLTVEKEDGVVIRSRESMYYYEIFKKVSDSAKPKFEIVIGNNNNADAKIAGITPA